MQLKSSRGVQQHQVDAAADALLAEGARPTVERVRIKIGRGSPNTVGPLLENWFANLAGRLGGHASAEAGAKALPPPLRDALQDLWGSALSQANEQAKAGVAQDQAQLAEDRAALEDARAQLALQEAALTERRVALEHALDLAKVQLKDQAAQLQDALHQLAQARASLAKLVEERDADRRRFDLQAEAAGRERERLQAREQATERRLLEEVDRARQEAKQARSEQAEVVRRHEAALAEADRRLRGAGESQAQAHLEATVLRERLTAAEQRTTDLLRQLDAARSAPAVPALRVRKSARPRRKTASS